MKYLPTALEQLRFAWKLYHYARSGNLDRQKLDVPVVFQEGEARLVLTGPVFQTDEDLILACENNLVIAFGAAAITLNRCREEAGAALPDPVVTEVDHFVGLVYQIRNAFAHDIAEPRWNITAPRFRQVYAFGRVRVDLTEMHGKPFDYHDIGGPEVLFWIADYGEAKVWPDRVD